MTSTAPRIIPRPRQRKAAKAVVKNILSGDPIPTGQVMEMVGYSEGVQRTPSIVTESIGFKQAIRDLGLTEELITASLVEDIEAKKGGRVQELKLGAEILGMVKREEEAPQKGNTNYTFIFNEQAQSEIKAMEARIKATLIDNV